MSIEKERIEFKNLLIANPNYFGSAPELNTQPILAMKGNTKYEELSCVGFYPDKDLLEAIIQVKLSNGYKGDLCSGGSFEYVRFFIDWNGSGNFVDVGMASVNVHDVPDSIKTCLDKTKPLSYAVTVQINSDKKPCTIPNLVKVRAILSWDVPPTAGNPNYPTVWGNVIEKWIQIKPAGFIVSHLLEVADIKKLNINASMLSLNTGISQQKTLLPAELKELYKAEDVPSLRYNVQEISQTAAKIKIDPSLMVSYKLDPKYAALLADINAVILEKPNTKFEQLTCVGLNSDLNMLFATLTMKLSSGYSGNLCTAGSREYVAFWAYMYDQIKGVCIWQYLGTSSVNVYDVKNTTGLEYAVTLPYDFSNYQDKCEKPKILKIRAILSWQTPPPTNNWSYNPIWGNIVDSVIQLKPTLVPTEGLNIPFISAVGGMAVENISGNPQTVISSALGAGFANGPSILGGFNAIDSPFGGSIAICGHISNPPNNPQLGAKLKYKVQYRKNGEPNWTDISNPFWIWISKWDGVAWTMIVQKQIANSGYYEYQEDILMPDESFVEGNVLAQLYTPISDGNGLYEIRVLVADATAPLIIGVPIGHRSSNVVKIEIDNTPMKAELTIDLVSDEDFIAKQGAVTTTPMGECGTNTVGKYIVGRFSVKDVGVTPNFNYYGFDLLPAKIKNVPTPQNFKHLPIATSYPVVPTSGIILPPPPLTKPLPDGVWQLDTHYLPPCGYVVRISGKDRTIVNSGSIGWYFEETLGFCLSAN